MNDERETIVRERLIELCDLVGERIAIGENVDISVITDLHKRLWDLRWELDLPGGAPVSLVTEGPKEAP